MTNKPTAADQWTFTFYGLAAATSLVGQVWAGANHITLDIPFWVKCLLIAGPVIVIEVFGVAMAARGDMRMRLGLPGTRYLALSGAATAFAVALNFFGHAEHGSPSWWSWLFASIGLGAYVVFLFHSADRRNDAAEQRNHRAGATPDYGLWRRLTQRDRVRLATELAQEHKLGLFDSLRAADKQIADERRRAAVATVLTAVIRAEHADKKMADLAVACVDIDRLAADTADNFDYEGLSTRIATALSPRSGGKVATKKPAPTREFKASDSGDEEPKKPGPKPTPDKGRRELTTAEQIVSYHRRYSAKTTTEIAAKFGVSERTVQRALKPSGDDTDPVPAPPAMSASDRELTAAMESAFEPQPA